MQVIITTLPESATYLWSCVTGTGTSWPPAAESISSMEFASRSTYLHKIGYNIEQNQ